MATAGLHHPRQPAPAAGGGHPPPAEDGLLPRALVVDDDELAFRLLEESLRLAGDFETVWARNGLRALEECDKRTPDIILLDLSMPEMGGFEFLERFRTRPEAETVPVLLVSGEGGVSDRILGLELGAVDYVAKPFEPMEVAIRAKRHLTMRRLYTQTNAQRIEIAEKADFLATILDSVPSGFAVINESLTILECNQQFSSLFPRAEGKVQGEDFVALCRTEQMERGREAPAGPKAPLSEMLRRALTEGRDFRNVEVVLPGSGEQQEERYLILMITRFPSRNDRLLLDVRDFTAQKDAEKKMARRDRLAVLGDLSIGVAHEINNPNAFIRLNAANINTMLRALGPAFDEAIRSTPGLRVGTMSAGEVKDRLFKAVKDVLTATERISHVVDRLKTFGRAEESGSEEVDLATVVKDAMEMTAHELNKIENVDYERPDAPLPPVLGTRVEFGQVLINMLVNSVHAIEKRREGEPGGFTGRLRLWFETRAGEVSLLVADNGTGMDETTAKKIFTPYFTTKPRGKGTGLGLSISHGIISKYKGRTEVRSALGQGTTIRISFPAAPAPGRAKKTAGERQ